MLANNKKAFFFSPTFLTKFTTLLATSKHLKPLFFFLKYPLPRLPEIISICCWLLFTFPIVFQEAGLGKGFENTQEEFYIDSLTDRRYKQKCETKENSEDN